MIFLIKQHNSTYKFTRIQSGVAKSKLRIYETIYQFVEQNEVIVSLPIKLQFVEQNHDIVSLPIEPGTTNDCCM